MPIHKAISETAPKYKAESESHKWHGQQPERLHFLRRQPDSPGCDRAEIVPDLLCSFSHEYSVSSRVFGIRRLIIRVGDRHDHVGQS